MEPSGERGGRREVKVQMMRAAEAAVREPGSFTMINVGGGQAGET